MVRRKPSEVRKIKSSRRSEEAIQSPGRLDENIMCNRNFCILRVYYWRVVLEIHNCVSLLVISGTYHQGSPEKMTDISLRVR